MSVITLDIYGNVVNVKGVNTMTQSKTKKKRTSNIPKDESKHAKFKRVCTPRLRKALKAIKQVGACSSKQYAYTNEQVCTIVNSLIKAVGSVEKQYTGVHQEETAIEL